MKFKGIHGAPILLTVITALLIGFYCLDTSVFGGDENLYLTIITAQLVIFALPAVFYARLRGRKFLSHLRIRFFKVSSISLMVFALGLMIFGGATLCFVLYRLFPEIYSGSMVKTITDATGSVSGSVLYSVVAFAIIPAITEELLYRGVVVAEYERGGAALAVFFSSLAFSLIHFSLARIPVYFFYGVVLAMVLYATRSLVASTVVHMANNIFVMFFEKYIYRAAVRQGGGIVLFGFICVSLFLVFAALFFGAAQRSYSEMAEENVPSKYAGAKKESFKSRFVYALLSPAFITLAVVSIVGALVVNAL